MINKHLTQKGASWPLYAAVSAYAMNTFASTALQGLSPFELVFARKPQQLTSFELPKLTSFPVKYREFFRLSLGFGRNNHGPMTELNSNTSEYLTEAIHITICNQYKNKYIKLLEQIETIKQNITYKIEKVMPRLMPNENAIIYGKETQSDVSRQKRVIPLGLIFSGVSAIGGLIMKGVNMWSNYKKSKAMTKAVEKLYEAQEIDHRRLTRLEGQTSLLAKTTKTAFQHIDYRLLHLDTKGSF